MFSRILVPLDGSQPAERTLPVAAQLARALDSTLILVQVAQPMIPRSNLLLEKHEQVGAYLTRVTERPVLAGVRYETVALVGSPAEKILDTLQAYRCDSVILCSHGRTGLLRSLPGSVAQRVVYEASVPLLLLHQQGPLPILNPPRRLCALVPLDGSGAAEAALAPAVTLVGALAPLGQGILHLVQVVPFPLVERRAGLPKPPEARARETALQEAHDYLYRVAEQLRREPLARFQTQITWSVIANKDVAGALIDLVQQNEPARDVRGPHHFDLIAMTTHGHGGFRHLVMGSITERILSVSKLPLLLIRPQEGKTLS